MKTNMFCFQKSIYQGCELILDLEIVENYHQYRLESINDSFRIALYGISVVRLPIFDSLNFSGKQKGYKYRMVEMLKTTIYESRNLPNPHCCFRHFYFRPKLSLLLYLTNSKR